MNIRTEFPFQITETNHLWIPLPDGTRLAARMWQAITDTSMPVILETIPYRKSDMMAISDAARYRYLAGCGYTCLRVDIRGSGDSEGLMQDEYTAQEQTDGYHLIQWIAEQDWCDGNVGLTGISWGGFNSLQIAAKQPPALKAIISACSTDNRFTDDVHYRSDCVLAEDMLGWSASMMSIMSKPPNPDAVGDDWYDIWLNRLAHLPHLAEKWLAHQTYDAYWQQGSVCETYADIQCPTFLIGGWSDGYRDSIFRLLQHLTVPRLGLIGPWCHGWPDNSLPGPQIGYLQETLRWWDHWLKGKDTGIMAEPQLRYWQQEFSEPATNYKYRPGRWLGLAQWPANSLSEIRFHIVDDKLTQIAGDQDSPTTAEPALKITPEFSQGQDAGVWSPTGGRKLGPLEQSRDDAVCLSFESTPLDNELNLIGPSRVSFTTQANAGQIIVRLIEVDPSGTALLISRGFKRLTGEISNLEINLDSVGHRISVGNKLRLGFSVSYWPMLWPATKTQAIAIKKLRLRLVCDCSVVPADTKFSRPELAGTIQYDLLEPPSYQRRTEVSPDGYRLVTNSSSGKLRLQNSLTTLDESHNEMNLDKDFKATVLCERNMSMTHRAGKTQTQLVSKMSADNKNFYLSTEISAGLDDAKCFKKSWQATIPRQD